MRWGNRLGGLLLGLAVLGGLLAAADQHSADWDQNARLLEKWKADPEHYARLQTDLRAFWALPPERQGQLRRLDRELHPNNSPSRLWGVLRRYVLWLDRLPEEQRNRILSASGRAERLELIRNAQKEQQNQLFNRLPPKDQEEIKKLPPNQYDHKINEQWRRWWLNGPFPGKERGGRPPVGLHGHHGR
jgi:hypothetical protein